MKKLAFLTLSICICGITFAQPWKSAAQQELNDASYTENFYDIKTQVDDYFKNHDQGRGSGYKQFQRFAWFMEPRVYPSGIFNSAALWEAWEIKQNRLKSGNFTANWSPLGPVDVPVGLSGGRPRGAGRVNCIAFHPSNPDVIYLGAPSGGVWITNDGGNTWRTTTDQLPALGVSDLAIDPNNPSILYLVTGDKDGGNTSPTYSYGILKSTDAGETWQATGLVHETSSTIRMRRILIHPEQSNILITAGSPGLYRSTDAGDSWEQIQSGNFFDLEFKPGDPNTVYACTSTTLYKSTDAGLSFTKLETGLPATSEVGRTEMAVTRANPEVIYSVMSNKESGFLGLYKSSDSGDHWTAQSTQDSLNIFSYAYNGSGSDGIAWYAIALTVDQEDENIVISGSVNLWRSINGGVDWTISAHWTGSNGSQYVHADEHTLSVNPLNNVCYSGNDGGFYKSEDKGITWIDVSDGLSILQIYKMGASDSNPNLVLEGSQDNGTYMFHDGEWHSVYGGDGMECAVDPVNPDIMFCTTQNGNLVRTVNGARDWSGVRPSSEGAWITPFEISKLNHNIIVAGYEALYLSTNYANSWEKISGELASGSNMNEIAIAPGDDRYIYVSSGANIWMTRDRGENWANIGDGIPNLTIEDIKIAYSEPEKVWVTLSGYQDNQKVFYTEDGGNSWINYSDGLPNVPVNCITYNKHSNYALYAGTDLGVYYRNPSLSEWVPYDDGLPNVIVNEMEINYRVNKLRAATFGRGLWESDIIDDGNWPPAIFLTAVAGNGYIDLAWIAPTERTPDHYEIFRNGSSLASSTTNYFKDEVENGFVYTYQIKAVYADGSSTPTNQVISRGEEPIELPYNQEFDLENHGWLIKNTVSGWQWGTGPELKLNLLGDSKMVGINSTTASQSGKTAQDYAIMPKINLAGKSELIMQFDYALRRWQQLDHLYLVYRTPDNPDWTTLLELEPTGRMWAWKNYQMDIPPEVFLDEIEIAFYYTDSKDIGYGAAIDNFYIGPNTTGRLDLENIGGLDVYPNPAQNKINLEFTGTYPQKMSVEIIDNTGKILMRKMLEPLGVQQLSIATLPKGLYHVRCSDGNQYWIKQFTKN